jgi:hypothetical protein
MKHPFAQADTPASKAYFQEKDFTRNILIN